MAGKKTCQSFPKKLAWAMLALSLSVSGSMILPQGAAAQENAEPPRSAWPPGTLWTPGGTPYNPEGMRQEYGPGWRKVLKDYDSRVAQWKAQRKKRFKGAEKISFSEDMDSDGIMKFHPFLAGDLQTAPENTHMPIAESKYDNTSLNFFFIYKRMPSYCNAHGCPLDVYVDNGDGKGFSKAMSTVSMSHDVYLAKEGKRISLFLKEQDGYVEWFLNGRTFEENDPPED